MANTVSNEPRVAGAMRLVDNLRNNQKIRSLVMKMETLSEALISLAYLDQAKCRATAVKEKYNIPPTAPIMKIKGFGEVLVPTYSLPVNKSGNYTNIIGTYLRLLPCLNLKYTIP